MFENAVNIAGNSLKTFEPGDQYPSPLEAGVYDVWSEGDIYIKVDATDASDVTSDTGYLVKAGNTVSVRIQSNMYLGAAGSTDIYFHKVA